MSQTTSVVRVSLADIATHRTAMESRGWELVSTTREHEGAVVVVWARASATETERQQAIERSARLAEATPAPPGGAHGAAGLNARRSACREALGAAGAWSARTGCRDRKQQA